MENQHLVMERILDKSPTEMYYTEGSVFREDLNTDTNRTFELGNSGDSTPTRIVVGVVRFQATNKIEQLHNST